MAENEMAEETQEEQPVSRITVVFVGPGMADVAGSKFEHITVGQMLAFAKWAEWQADRAILKMETERQQREKERKEEEERHKPKIIVPGLLPIQ